MACACRRGGRVPGAGPGRHQLPRAAAGAARRRAGAPGRQAVPHQVTTLSHHQFF